MHHYLWYAGAPQPEAPTGLQVIWLVSETIKEASLSGTKEERTSRGGCVPIPPGRSVCVLMTLTLSAYSTVDTRHNIVYHPTVVSAQLPLWDHNKV